MGDNPPNRRGRRHPHDDIGRSRKNRNSEAVTLESLLGPDEWRALIYKSERTIDSLRQQLKQCLAANIYSATEKDDLTAKLTHEEILKGECEQRIRALKNAEDSRVVRIQTPNIQAPGPQIEATLEEVDDRGNPIWNAQAQGIPFASNPVYPQPEPYSQQRQDYGLQAREKIHPLVPASVLQGSGGQPYILMVRPSITYYNCNDALMAMWDPLRGNYYQYPPRF